MHMINYRVSLIANSDARSRAWVGASIDTPMAANLSRIVVDALTDEGCVVTSYASGGADVSAEFTAPDDHFAVLAFRSAITRLASGARLFRMDATEYGATGVVINHYGVTS